MTEQALEIVQKEFLNLLITGNRLKCSEIVQNMINKNISIKDLYEKVIKKALYDIGELWEHNIISVATEHLASAIVEAILNELYASVITKERINKTVIVACVENEFHQIGIKMISDVFEMNGWNSRFLGANTPTKELIDFAKLINPDMLAISLSIYFHLPIMEKMIQIIRNEFPSLSILVGGQAFLHGGQNIISKYHNVFYQPDLISTELYFKKINQNGL